MSEREEAATGAITEEAGAPRMPHRARAHSAYDRAVAACRYAGVGQDAAEVVPRDPVGRAANALRLSAESLAALTASAPDPAADARCARNAAATAALAAQVAAARGNCSAAAAPDSRASGTTSMASAAALRAALAASQAAALAAGGGALGQDATLNASAEEAERHAVAMARAAGWLEVSTTAD
ncbi:hypothetical protein ABT288_01140 [Streptomyces sp. NPDC001093]|uniref:hypothetical protein n=1 Tax=Streptomyces sp. NPDC001093 TaxID=3154376 RepID=UPI00332D54C4